LALPTLSLSDRLDDGSERKIIVVTNTPTLRTGRAARPFRNPRIRRGAAAVSRRLLNPVVRALAGTPRLPLFAVVHHRGRHSGRPFATPVAARRTEDGFVIPLTFGDQADWFRNVRAAGGCVIRWNGVDYPVVEPEIVDWATAGPAFTAVERTLLGLFGMEHFARLRDAPAQAINPARGGEPRKVAPADSTTAEAR